MPTLEEAARSTEGLEEWVEKATRNVEEFRGWLDQAIRRQRENLRHATGIFVLCTSVCGACAWLTLGGHLPGAKLVLVFVFAWAGVFSFVTLNTVVRGRRRLRQLESQRTALERLGAPSA